MDQQQIEALIERLRDEAAKCDLFGITKPAELLCEAAEALQLFLQTDEPVSDVFGNSWPTWRPNPEHAAARTTEAPAARSET